VHSRNCHLCLGPLKLRSRKTLQGILKERFPDGRKISNTVRVEPELADKPRAHSAVITGMPSSLTF
jgi:hypothetical protein